MKNIIDIRSREQAIKHDIASAKRWMYEETRNEILWAGVTPWRCECGFEARWAGTMWDHVMIVHGTDCRKCEM